MPDRSASRPDDEALLAGLASALAPDDVRPPATTIRALRAAVADMGPAVARRGPATGWVRHRWAVAGGAVALLTLGTGTAFAAGVPVPPAIRILATDVGLPVTPQPVIDVRNATTSLQQTLRSASADPAGTAATAGRLAKLIHDLPPSQRSEVPVIAPALLHQACRQVFPSSAAPMAGQDGSRGPIGWPGCPGAYPTPGIPTRPTGEPVPTTTLPGRPPTGSNPAQPGTPTGHPGGGEPGRPSTPGTTSPKGPGNPSTSTTWPVGGSRPGPPESYSRFRAGAGGSRH